MRSLAQPRELSGHVKALSLEPGTQLHAHKASCLYTVISGYVSASICLLHCSLPRIHALASAPVFIHSHTQSWMCSWGTKISCPARVPELATHTLHRFAQTPMLSHKYLFNALLLEGNLNCLRVTVSTQELILLKDKVIAAMICPALTACRGLC